MISQDYFMVAKQFEILQFFVVIDLMQMDKQRECLECLLSNIILASRLYRFFKF